MVVRPKTRENVHSAALLAVINEKKAVRDLVDRSDNEGSDNEKGHLRGNFRGHFIHNESKLNIKAVLCKRCGSIIIKENVATLLFEPERKITLPSMVKGANAVQEDVDTFWLLKSPMEFENVGFTNNVNNIKYLCCADCEVGPVGLAMSTKNNEFLVAANRVDYK